jgi:hypothetical protein
MYVKLGQDFIYLFNAVSSLDYIALNDMMTNEYWIGKAMEENNCGLYLRCCSGVPYVAHAVYEELLQWSSYE